MQSKEEIIKITEKFIKDRFSNEFSGHDVWHILRVRNNAINIQQHEGGNRFIIEMAALLHDIADAKFYDGDVNIGAIKTEEYLNSFDISPFEKNEIINIVKNISFKGVAKKNENLSLEGYIVQDADRLDVLGAIGIARVFAYSGATNRPIYDPNLKPILNHTTETYYKNNNSAINHFYEKLLLLKDLMNTDHAKKIAEVRHNFMINFLNQFFTEINNSDNLTEVLPDF